MFGKLTFVSASSQPIEYVISQRLTYVGRDKDCSVRLEDPSVDGKQFVITAVDNVVTIRNLSRKLPTLINQKAIGIREDKVLKDQDCISFGNKQFQWTMNASCGKKNPPRHDCLKRTRNSEPVRKVAVVTPNRRMPLNEAFTPVEMPPEKRRRTMFDPSSSTPAVSSFVQRANYDKRLKQKLSNRRKLSSKTPTPNVNSSKRKTISFAQPSGSPRLSFNHEAAANKSITPGRFYRRTDDPYQFRGFNPAPDESMSGFISEGYSFFGMDDSRQSHRSSPRVSTPYPNKSLRRGSSQGKTPMSGRPSGVYFPSIQEEPNSNQHDATPSSYFSSTTGSPRMMRAESPSVLPGGSYLKRQSLAQSSRSSSYSTAQDPSFASNGDSMFVNASDTRMSSMDFEGSSFNQTLHSWGSEGMNSPRLNSSANTPPHMRTPRRSRAPMESPGSAAFSPSESNTSGYVLLSPQGRSIINRAFNRNEISMRFSPQNSPARRLFHAPPRTPDRRVSAVSQPLSVQVLTKSLKKKLNRSVTTLNSCQEGKTPTSSGMRTPKSSQTRSPLIQSGTSESKRSSGLRRTPQSLDRPIRIASSHNPLSVSKTLDGTPVKHKKKDTFSPKLPNLPLCESNDLKQTPNSFIKNEPLPGSSKRSSRISRQSKDLETSKISRKSLDAKEENYSSPVEPKKSKRHSVGTPDSRSSVRTPVKGTPDSGARKTKISIPGSTTPNQHGTPKSTRSSGINISFKQEPVDTGVSPSKKSAVIESVSSPESPKASITMGKFTNRSYLSRRSLVAQRHNEPEFRLLRKSAPSSYHPHSEPKRRKPDESSGSTASPVLHEIPSPNKLTPQNSPVEVNRSSRKMTSARKDSLRTPLASPTVSRSSRSSLMKNQSGSVENIAQDKDTCNSPGSPIPKARKSAASVHVPAAHASPKTTPKPTKNSTSADSLPGSLVSRRSRASLVGDAAQLLHLASPEQSRAVPDIKIIPPTPTNGGTPVTDIHERTSRKSKSPKVVSVHRSVRKKSSGRWSINSNTSDTSGSIPGNTSGKRNSQRKSTESPIISPPRPSTPKTSKSMEPVTPPRSVGPEVVMRSSRKTPRILPTDVPSTPTSMFRRNGRRSCKRSPIPSISRRLSSPQKAESVKKLSLDPQKPDKNKIAALIACHKRKSPVKEESVTGVLDEVFVSKNTSKAFTPPTDLEGKPAERSPEDNLLDALDLYRKSSILSVPKRPSRRLRSSVGHFSAMASIQSSSKSSPSSPPRSVKKLLFKTPLVEYEGSQSREQKSPSRTLKGILMPTPSASEEPMSRVFTTSPVVDFTDVSGRKKTFRTSPNSKSKAGGIHELVPADESDMNIWTLFDDSPKDFESSGRQRKSPVPMGSLTDGKTKSPEMAPAITPRSSRRKKVIEPGSSSESRSAANSPKASQPAPKTRRQAGKASTSKAQPGPPVNKAKPKKSTPPVKAKAVAKQPPKAASEAPKTQRQTRKPTAAPSPPKTRTRAVLKSPKKEVPEDSAKGKTSKRKPPAPSAVESTKGKKGAASKPERSPKTGLKTKSTQEAKQVERPTGKASRAKTTVSPSRAEAKPQKAAQSAKSKSRSAAKHSPKASQTAPKTRRQAGKASTSKAQPGPLVSEAKPKKSTPPVKAKAAKQPPKAASEAPKTTAAPSPPNTRTRAVLKSPKEEVPEDSAKAKTSKRKPPAPSAVESTNGKKAAASKPEKPVKPTQSPTPTVSQSRKAKGAAQAKGPKKAANNKSTKTKQTKSPTKDTKSKKKPRVSVAPKTLKGKAVGGNTSPPVATRTRKR